MPKYYKMTQMHKDEQITVKHLEVVQKKLDKSAQFAFVQGVVKISPTKVIPAIGDTQYYLLCEPSNRNKIANFLEKSKIAYVSIVSRDSLPPLLEIG